MAKTDKTPTAISAGKINKLKKLRVRTDAESLEGRVTPFFAPMTRGRKALSAESSLALYNLPELIIFLENLVNSRGPIYLAHQHPVSKEYALLEIQLGMPFQRCIQLKLEKLKEELPDYTFHPALAIFNQYQLAFPYREALIQPTLLTAPADRAAQYARAAYETADRLRGALSAKIYQRQVNAFIQATNRNYRTLMSYVELLFDKSATLWVIRLDLGYAGAMDDYDVVKHDREKLLRNLRKFSPVGEPFGYAWKLERPTNRTWRHHFLFFFTPQKGQTPAGIAQALGEYWKSTITKRQGAFRNCNADSKGSRRRLGTGEIHRTRFSPDSPNSPLEQAIWYMTQLDYYIKLRPDAKWKTFFGGNHAVAEAKPSIARRIRKKPPTLAQQYEAIAERQAMPMADQD